MPRTPVANASARSRPIMFGSLALVLLLLATASRTPAAEPEKASDEELKKIQGTWERTDAAENAPYRKATKEIKGNKETVTYFDADGKVIHKHQVDFKLSKAGNVGLFKFSNLEVTEGPQKGQKMEGDFTYVYRAMDDEFREAQGMLAGDQGDPALNVWKKVGAKGDAAVPAAADKPAAIDAKALAGTWEPTMNQRGGNVEPEEQSKRHRLVFDGDKYTILRDGERLIAGTYKVNNDVKPAQIDMVIDESQNAEDQGKTVLGIIEVTGDGMKWCTGGPRSTERPKEFASEDGSRDMFVMLKREKKKAE